MTKYLGLGATWVRSVTSRQVIETFGLGAYHRGVEYARSGHVLVLTCADGRQIEALVSGTASVAYETSVSPLRRNASDPDRVWIGANSCTCPLGGDCKHVVAALIVAQDWQLLGVESKPDWQVMLDAVLAESQVAQGRDLGLRFEFAKTRYDRGSRVLLKPVTQGKNGWIKTGATWHDIEYNYSRPPLNPLQRDVLMELLLAYRAGGQSFQRYGDTRIHLDELGASVWPLLRRSISTGIALIGPDAATDVVIAAGPASVILDLRHVDGQQPEMHGQILRESGEPLPPNSLLIGDPAHGFWSAQPGRLELGELSAPINAGTIGLLTSGPVRIPESDLNSFLFTYYPALRRDLTITSSDGTVALPDVSGPRLELSVDFRPGHVTQLSWKFAYAIGDQKTRFGLTDTSDARRDHTGEREILKELNDFSAGAAWNPVQTSGAVIPVLNLTGIQTADFVVDVLPLLAAHPLIDLVVTGEPMAYSETSEAPVVSVTASDTNDSDWFELDVTVTVDGEQVELAQLLMALAVGDARLLLDSGKSFSLDRPDLIRLRELLEEARSLQDKTGTTIRITPIQAGWWEELVSLGVIATQSARWQRSVGALLDLDHVAPPEPPIEFRTELRPYQRAGFQWLSRLWDCRLGGVLADDMGLGKTVQTLAMATRAAAEGTLGGNAGALLIVAPTSVVSTWAEQSQAFCPHLRTVVITETESRSGSKIRNTAEQADIVVTSYALFRIDEDSYGVLDWSGLVLDEAQFVKNHKSKTYQAARKLNTDFKLAITGTPLENSVMDLWSMLSITAPGLFPNPQRFTEEYRRPIENHGDADALAKLRRRVRPLMLRRTKEAVASDLPPKTEQVLHVTLHPKHQRIYDTHLNRERQRVLGMLDDIDRNRIAILSSLTTLRQLSLDAGLIDEQYRGKIPSAKIDVLVEQLQEIAAEGHRALVFSQFTRFLREVRSRLTEAGLSVCYLDGRTQNRPRRIAEFVDGDACAFLISLKAGGFGLNLTAADYVYVLDPWWNPAAEAQAIDRTHRIGQDKPVMVYRMISVGTIEEKVVALQDRKRELFASVIDGDGTGTALNAADIRELLSH